MILTRHPSRDLAAYIDQQLSETRRGRIESHIAGCTACRNECDQIRVGMAVLENLRMVEAPDGIWSVIERQLQARPAREPWRRWALAAALVVAAIGLAYWGMARHSGVSWEVVRLAGAPVVGSRPIGASGRIGAGEWIETDAGSRAAVKIGEIGSVDVEPNTRVRVLVARPSENRLALARGEIRAKISAPPRLFFVDTAAGTAVDLGCEYALQVDADGFGRLEVTKGWVLFQWKGLESLVPAGASCRTRPQAGPGAPFFDDAAESVKQALERYAFETGGSDDLSIILGGARVRDTLTLWHLLSRVPVEERERVYDRMAALTPVPEGVSREQALQLDAETLKRWREELAWTW
jgi:ferric-dicitrate binding protein FerR (iron transport regulator)